MSIRQGYGMTELSPMATIAHPKHDRPGSVGFLVPNCEAKIIDPVRINAFPISLPLPVSLFLFLPHQEGVHHFPP